METAVSFQYFASSIADPRQQAKVLYPLDEILLLSLCGIVAGCESFVDIVVYGEEKLEFLRKLAPFEHGIPSHDTLSAVFRALDPGAFSAAFAGWASSLTGRLDGAVVAIDGKTARGSKAGGETPLHLISAWCDDLRLVLGQRASAHKKNEIRDIPVLLDLLCIEGAIVTLDAMGCQRQIAAKIRDKGADYVLALKGNQGLLHEDVALWFEQGDQGNTESLQTVDGDKGRIETRSYTQCDDIAWLRERHPQWVGLTSIGRVASVREHGGKTTRQTRYFISSLPNDATRFAHAVRSHWGIENRLHWVLDVTFRDDDSRVRKDHAPANFAVIKHIAMNLISKAKGKHSLRIRRKKAGWSNQFLLQILQT
ncbi:MAG: ISAs1 family transposase [Novosphingobium sp.]